MENAELPSSPKETEVSAGDDTSGSEDEPELMVKSRARRITAGNRYSNLLAQEEPIQDEEDEVAMLFAEGEGEDEEYNSDEGDEDADMSSSDDDDQGPNTVNVEDAEGEKELEKEAKAERAKKRKADLALTTVAGLRKKPRIDPTSLRRAHVPKPTKRKERVSWLPDQETAPGRTSLRKQTILHRAETHAKLKENEAHRLKQKAKREKREKEREAEAPKEMTQADRLAEAARVERRNAKSLNRWEAMEKKRAEEQAAKLAALKERKLEGAVVTWYSSSAKYYGLKEIREPEPEVPIEAKKRGRKSKAFLEQLAAAKLANGELSTPSILPKPASVPGQTSGVPAAHASNSTIDPQPQITFTAPQGPSNFFLTGIHEYASMQSDPNAKSGHMAPTQATTNDPGDVTQANVAKVAPPDTGSQPLKTNPSSTTQTTGMLLPDVEQAKANIEEPPSIPAVDIKVAHESAVAGAAAPSVARTTDDHTSIGSDSITQAVDKEPTSPNKQPTPLLRGDGHTASTDAGSGKASAPSTATAPDAGRTAATTSSAAPAEPPIEVISTRNLVILEKFDDLSGPSRHDFGLFYNSRRTAKLAKPSQELCPITGMVAKYRDPATGIGYANAAAYKKLQELKSHQFRWSSTLGCYTGRTNVVARGVPEGFSGG